jgi:hypothetical protein
MPSVQVAVSRLRRVRHRREWEWFDAGDSWFSRTGGKLTFKFYSRTKPEVS